MESEQKTLYVKVAVAFAPMLLLAIFGMWQNRVLYASSFVLGALLQGLVPPRRHLVLALVGASIIALAYSFNFTSWLWRH